jgi:hypothetical protein
MFLGSDEDGLSTERIIGINGTVEVSDTGSVFDNKPKSKEQLLCNGVVDN